MSEVSTTPRGAHAPHATRSAEEEVDPELLELPAPPKRERTLTVAMLLFTALASIAMVFALRRDAAYAFAPASPADLGNLGDAPASALEENRFVRGHAMLGAARAIRYERPIASGSFRLMPAVGRAKVWVEVRVPPNAESVRWVPPEELTGRLVSFQAAGPKHRGLASAVRDATGQEVPKDAWLLVDGEAPEGARWAILLLVMFSGFALWNVVAAVRLLRRVKA